MLLGRLLTPPVGAFIEAATTLDAATLRRVVRASAIQQDASDMQASRRTRLGEDQSERLREAILEHLRPRAAELRAEDAGLLSTATSVISVVCRAIRQPRRLDEAAFEALVEPFREVGVPVPTHARLRRR